MKMKIHVCDICKKNKPDAKIKYKYRANVKSFGVCGMKWYRIELCQECLDKIIKADKGSKNE